jgi:hypothetical protein
MVEDVVNVRIYQGIHFRTPDEVGRKQGERVADWVFGDSCGPSMVTTTRTMTMMSE